VSKTKQKHTIQVQAKEDLRLGKSELDVIAAEIGPTTGGISENMANAIQIIH
jgi:hypothetical protein